MEFFLHFYVVKLMEKLPKWPNLGLKFSGLDYVIIKNKDFQKSSLKMECKCKFLKHLNRCWANKKLRTPFGALLCSVTRLGKKCAF